MPTIFHVHTDLSNDSSMSLEKIAATAKCGGVNNIILTDHNEFTPSKQLDGINFIGGEEILTQDGEIIGFFLKEKILPNLSLQKTIDLIKRQKGLIAVPHPFDRLRHKKIKYQALLDNINEIDVIEIFNSRNIFNADNLQALNFAKKHNKLTIVGSDAHFAVELLNTTINIDQISTAENFLERLKTATFTARKSSLLGHAYSKFCKYLK